MKQNSNHSAESAERSQNPPNHSELHIPCTWGVQDKVKPHGGCSGLVTRVHYWWRLRNLISLSLRHSTCQRLVLQYIASRFATTPDWAVCGFVLSSPGAVNCESNAIMGTKQGRRVHFHKYASLPTQRTICEVVWTARAQLIRLLLHWKGFLLPLCAAKDVVLTQLPTPLVCYRFC